MPHVSKNKLSKETEEKLIQSLTLVFSTITKQDEMFLFLTALLSDTERVMLAKRLAIVVLLLEGVSDSDISSALHVTRMTVAKLRYYYEAQARAGYDLAFAKLTDQKQLEIYKKVVISLVRYSIKAAGGRL